MADPTISFTGDATSLLKAYAEVDAAIKKQAAALTALKKENNEAAKAEREASREAEQIKKRAVSAEDQYTSAVGRAKELLEKNKISQKEYNHELERQKRLLMESQGAADGMGSKLAGAGKEAMEAVAGIGMSLASVAGVIGAIKQEYEDFKARANESRSSQLTFGESMRDLASNFTPDASMGMGQLEGAVTGLVNRTGMSDRNAASALSAALSGRGSLSNAAAVQIAEQAGRVLPGDSEVTNQLALRTGQLMNSMGISDPREALGMIAQVKNVATVDKLRDVGQTAVPAMMSLKRHGDSAEQSAELFTAINLLMGDTEGSRSRTATEQLGQQLKEFLPAMGSTSARLAAVQADPSLRARFMQDANFETAAKTSMEALLSGSPEAIAAMATAGQIAAPNAPAFESYVAGINSLPSQRVVSNKARIDNEFRDLEIKDQQGARDAEAIEIFDRTLGKIDFPLFDAPQRAFSSAVMQGKMSLRGLSASAAAAETLEDLGRNNGGGLSGEAVDLLRQQAASLRRMERGPAPENALGRQPAGR